MAKGREYPSERKLFVDAITGINIIRITSFPTIHENFGNCFTPDCKTLIFAVNKSDRRNTYSQYDIFKVNVDGHGLTQISEGFLMGPHVSPNERSVYFTGSGWFSKLNIDSLEETQISPIPPGFPNNQLGFASMTFDGRIYLAHGTYPDGTNAFIRFSTNGKETDIVYKTKRGLMCPKIEPSDGNVIVYQTGSDEKNRNLTIVDIKTSTEKPLDLPYGNGHWSWHGPTKRIMTCCEFNKQKGISIYGEGDEKPQNFGGHCYWHATSGIEGKWIIADTNWPDTGLTLINTDTGKTGVVCYPGSSSAHPQWTHCHPTLSPDSKIALYKSDKDYFPHLYLAFIPDEMKKELATG